jgi:excinuclease UvrABC nuclease subunit
MSDRDRLQEKVAEYCNRYCISPVFEISEPFDIERDLTAYYPNSNSAGCYAIYTASGELLYIGKASNKHVMGFRLGNIWKLNADRTAPITKKDWGDKKPQIIQTIPVHEPYEAPSLEEFLILTLQPPCNIIGRTKRETAIDSD